MSSTVQTMVHCGSCDRPTMHLRERPSHGLHLFLTIITLGFWIIPWSWVTLAAGRPRCSVCGTEVGMFQMKR